MAAAAACSKLDLPLLYEPAAAASATASSGTAEVTAAFRESSAELSAVGWKDGWTWESWMMDSPGAAAEEARAAVGGHLLEVVATAVEAAPAPTTKPGVVVHGFAPLIAAVVLVWAGLLAVLAWWMRSSMRASGSRLVDPSSESSRKRAREESSAANLAAAAGQPAAPAGGRLVEFATHDDNFACDSCAVPQPAGCQMYGCRAENYDICKACYQRLAASASAAAEEAAAAVEVHTAEARPAADATVAAAESVRSAAEKPEKKSSLPLEVRSPLQNVAQANPASPKSPPHKKSRSGGAAACCSSPRGGSYASPPRL